MYATMPQETREEQLVKRAQKGDQEAFAELCRTLRDPLLATIRGRMGSAARAAIDPEDMLQATFVRAVRSVPRFEWRGEGSFRRWLQSIATHVVLDAIRLQGRIGVLKIDRDVATDGTSPSQALRRRERLDRLQRSMQALSPDYRTVLKLSRMEGLPVKEIAARMGRSESAVKNLLLRATRQLKQSFGDTESLNLGHEVFDDTRTRDDH